MSTHSQDPALLEAFPFLHRVEPAFLDELNTSTGIKTVSEGQFICMEGNHCSFLPMVLEGRARVYKSGETGREITLYRVEQGESCIITSSCLLNRQPFPAFAIAETDVRALLVPPALFRQWFERYPDWRNYILGLLSTRLTEVIELVEEIAFKRMDERLATYLVGTVSNDGIVRATHERMATELGTSREVVTRLLRDFEREGIVSLSRGAVRILDRAHLVRLV